MSRLANLDPSLRGRPAAAWVLRVPPTSFFLVSAVFHYVGPALAVLLFARVDVLGVAWLRIATAAAVFAIWRRPWRRWGRADLATRRTFVLLGVVLATMNTLFYLACDRLPLATVGAIEFLGTVVLAAAGSRTRRNVLALLLAVGGVSVLTQVRLSGELLGFVFAFANCLGFTAYVVLGHRIANAATTGSNDADDDGKAQPDQPDVMSGIDQLGLAMLMAAAAATPAGLVPALPAFGHPTWLLWGVGVGVCSSVIPYVTDQLAMARMPRATYALLVSLLPATATVIGVVVLAQVPAAPELAGVALVIAGVAVHREPRRRQAPDGSGPRKDCQASQRAGSPETCSPTGEEPHALG